MLKKIDSKKLMYYVLLIGVLVLLVVYFLVYKKYLDKTDVLVNENSALSERVAVLKEYYDNRLMYEESITAMTDDINVKLSELPADVKEEDILMLAVGTMQDNIIGYTSISVSDREPLYDIDRSVVGKAQIEGLSDNLTFVKRTVHYVNNVDYYNLKNVVANVLTTDNKKNISVISYTSSESETDEESSDFQYLEGTITVQFFSVLGTGKPYIRPDIPDYEAGLSNIFGFNSITIPSENGI